MTVCVYKSGEQRSMRQGDNVFNSSVGVRIGSTMYGTDAPISGNGDVDVALKFSPRPREVGRIRH